MSTSVADSDECVQEEQHSERESVTEWEFSDFWKTQEVTLVGRVRVV